MATELVPRRRRQLLLAAASGLAWPLAAGTAAAGERDVETLCTSWDDTGGRHHAGLLGLSAHRVRVLAAIELPTRAHGVAMLPDGSLLVAARRPGEWLLRWRHGKARTGLAEWHWAAPDRHFSGHVLVAPAGDALFSTEIDRRTGAGLLVRRHPKTLAPEAVWPTQGLDPHDIEWLPTGHVLVANGGIATHEETGRAKLALERMDPSLARFDARSGRLEGQWRLPDPRLSIRHLARHASGVVGVALQAEHEQAAERAAAPLLALWEPDAQSLRCVAVHPLGSGYAGDVAALPAGWAVSRPHDDSVLVFSLDGSSVTTLPLASACALATDLARGTAWAIGRKRIMSMAVDGALRSPIDDWRPDNHAVLV